MLSSVEDSPCDLTWIAVHQKSPLTFLVEEIVNLIEWKPFQHIQYLAFKINENGLTVHNLLIATPPSLLSVNDEF